MNEQDLETTLKVETTRESVEITPDVTDIDLSTAFIKDKNKKFYICNIKSGVVECITREQLIKSKLQVGGTPDNELQFTYKDIYIRFKQGIKVSFSREVEQPDGSMKAFPCNYTIPSPSYKLEPKTPRLHGVQKSTQTISYRKEFIGNKITKSGQVKKQYKRIPIESKIITHKVTND